MSSVVKDSAIEVTSREITQTVTQKDEVYTKFGEKGKITVAHIQIVFSINHLRPPQLLSLACKMGLKLHAEKGRNDPIHPHRLSSPLLWAGMCIPVSGPAHNLPGFMLGTVIFLLNVNSNGIWSQHKACVSLWSIFTKPYFPYSLAKLLFLL